MLAKTYYGFRFKPALYQNFKAVAKKGGYTVTGAFEHFMEECIDANELVFPDQTAGSFEVEARILVDWLGKGKLFYRSEDGEEVNIQGRLLRLLPKINDATLKRLTEDVLKTSVTPK